MFQPNKRILENYADILINFALNDTKGIKKGEVVLLQVPESAKPLLLTLHNTILKAGAHMIIQYLPDEMQRDFYTLANQEQLQFFPAKYLKARIDQIDHIVSVIAETDIHELEGIDPKKIMQRNQIFKPYLKWRSQKENLGKLTWTAALYGTEAMAKEAGLTLEQCWKQIIKACYLDDLNPIQKWQQTEKEIKRLKENLDSLKIDFLRIESEKTDLTIKLGPNRKWLGGGGNNIPSFEVYISPDWRGTEGKIFFDLPLYRYGDVIKDIALEFKNGKVVNISATQGEKIIKEMIKVKGADQVGEFSLTDIRLSRIDRFMAETLFDENFGGKYGNTHLALGHAYQDSYPGDLKTVKQLQWAKMGYSESTIHTDIIATQDRQVTATLSNGDKKIIYKQGKFQI